MTEDAKNYTLFNPDMGQAIYPKDSWTLDAALCDQYHLDSADPQGDEAAYQALKGIECPSDLLGSLVTYNADPYLIETEEEAQEVYNDIMSNGLTPIAIDDDELSKIDLTEANNVKALYSFGIGIICLNEDWSF